MDVVKTLISTFLIHVFNTPPVAMTYKVREFIYKQNISRIIATVVVVLLVDIISISFYGAYYLYIQSLNLGHIAFHLFKIALDACALYLCNSKSMAEYNKKNFFIRNIDILIALIAYAIDFMLFLSGPEDLGAMIRLLALPFILSTVIIMEHKKAFLLNIIIYSVSGVYIFNSYLSAVLYIPAGYIMNLWFLSFPCSFIMSGFIYSNFVHIFVDKTIEDELKREREQLTARLDIMSRHDRLTGLSNQRDLEQFIDLTWSQEVQRSNSVSLIMLDIDYFKQYNDRFGHAKGDRCIVSVTQAISSCLENISDYIFVRYSGEEFLILAYGQRPDYMAELCEEMRLAVDVLKIENPDSPLSIYITISCGTVTMPVSKNGFKDALEIADKCLYLAKESGRARTIQFDCRSGKYLSAKGEEAVSNTKFSSSVSLGRSDLEKLYRSLKDFGIGCTFLFSQSTRVLEFSSSAQEILAMPSKVLEPSLEKVIELIPIAVETRKPFIDALRQCVIKQQRSLETELWIEHKSGLKFWISLHMNFAYDPRGAIEFVSGYMFLLEKLLEFSKYSDSMAMVDGITGLPNRARFFRDMGLLLDVQDSSGYLVMLDIHNFKAINGIFTHNIGDKTLRKVSEEIKRIVGKDVLVYHYNVDQFLLLFHNVKKELIEETVVRINKFFLTSNFMVDDIPMHIQFHVGAVEFGSGKQKLNDMLVNLDAALQKAKRDHQRFFHIFAEDEKTDYLQRINLEKEILESVHNNFAGFSLVYQPLCHPAGNFRCVGAEALLRWENNGQKSDPLTVVSILEKSGLISEAGRWILETACRQCSHWIKTLASEDFYVHENLSIVQIDKDSFVNDVLSILKKYELLPHHIVLEITESSFVSETNFVINILKTLRSKGIRISVDDFGTGYSSLSYLRTMPADQIKIDKLFLKGMENDASVRNVLKSVIDLVSSMGFSVCVEGVETQVQADFLKTLPVNLLQGYLLGRPLTPKSFEEDVFKANIRHRSDLVAIF